MPTPTPTPQLQKQTLNIIWFAMMGGLATYWVVKQLVVSRRPSSSTEAGFLVGPILLISTVMYGMAWWWFHTQVGQVARQPGPDGPNRLQTAVIICVAFLEIPVVMALISVFMGNPQPLFECALLASFIGLVWLRLTGYPKVFAILDRLT